MKNSRSLKLMFRSIRSVLSLVLIFQILFGSVILSAPSVTAAGPDSGDHQSNPPGKQNPVDEIFPIAEGLQTSGAKEGIAQAEDLIQEIQEAGEGQVPKRGVDFLGITGQRLEVDGKAYDLSVPSLSIPVITPHSGANDDRFENETLVEIDASRGEIHFRLVRDGKEIARQVLTGYKVKAFARDKELIQFSTEKGEIFAIDMVFARSAVFRMPLPVFHVGRLNEWAKTQGDYQLTFVHRGVRAPSEIPEEALRPVDVAEKDLWQAGSLMVYQDLAAGGRRLIGLYDRGVTMMQVWTGTAVLAFKAAMINPQGSPNDEAAKLLSDPMVAQRLEEISAGEDPAGDAAMKALAGDGIEAIRGHMQRLEGNASSPRDVFHLQEWRDSLDHFSGLATAEVARREQVDAGDDAARQKGLLARASNWVRNRANETPTRIETDIQEADGSVPPPQVAMSKEDANTLKASLLKGEFGSEWQKLLRRKANQDLVTGEVRPSFLYRAITPKAMMTMAALASGAFGVYLASVSTDGYASMWASHIASTFYNHYYPAVLKDAAYRWTLVKSSLSLLAFIPALYTVGSLLGAAKGWDYQKMNAIIGVRIFAWLQRPFFEIVAEKVLRQPNLVATLREGLNPFEKITPDSNIGKAAGVKDPVRLGFIAERGPKRAEALSLRQRILEAKVAERNRLKAYSTLLANLIVGKRYGIDPATMILVQTGKLTDANASTALADEGFRGDWAELSKSLMSIIQDMRGPNGLADIRSLSPEELLKDAEKAVEAYKQIRNQPRLARLAGDLKLRWGRLGAGVAHFVGWAGYEQHHKLKTAIPSEFVSRQVWQQFATDYAFTVGQMAIIGGRADLSKPDLLAAAWDHSFWGPKSLFWTNNPHMADMVEQVGIYGISVPGRTTMMWNQERDVREGLYKPVEEISLAGLPRPESFVRGMTKLFGWMAMSPRELDFGNVALKSITKLMQTFQANFTIGLVGRVAFAGTGLWGSIVGQSYVMFWKYWQYGWVWDILTAGLNHDEKRIAANNESLKKAKNLLGLGLRLDDEKSVTEGYMALQKLYSDNLGSREMREFRRNLRAVQDLLKIPAAQRNAMTSEMRSNVALMARLKGALETGSEVEMWEAYEALLAAYPASVADEARSAIAQEGKTGVDRASARALLEYSLRHPPVYTRLNTNVSWAVNQVGSFATTYMAVAMYLVSYDNPTPWDVAEATGKAAAMFAAAYSGQRAINYLAALCDAAGKEGVSAVGKKLVTDVADLGRGAKARLEKALDNAKGSTDLVDKAAEPKVSRKSIEASDGKETKIISLDEYRQRVVAQKAKAFGTSQDEVQRALSVGDKAAIEGTYRCLILLGGGKK